MATTKSESLVLVSKQNGLVIIPGTTPLTRLNYFDGKFLRASDLKAEQDYLRQLVAQSNQAGGSGVAYGFDVTLSGGDRLEIGQGLAIDPSGRVLLLPQGTSVGVQELIDKSRDLQRVFGGASVIRDGSFERCEVDQGQLPGGATQASNLYLIVISPADALCGEEDVYGKLCEEACATSTDRPFAVEGLTVRAIPLVLQTPLPSPKVVALTQAHLRSRVASAYFEDERRRVASLISAFGLQQETWCLGADAAVGSGVPIGVIARSGSTTIFLDPWIARRERIDAPARRYWQWRMMMRPWDVFLAHILQFQCQLRDLFRKASLPGGEADPCGGAHGAILEAADTITELKQFYEATAQRFTSLNVNLEEAITFKGGLSRLTALNDKLVNVGKGLSALPRDRFLINGGIVELPSAGYLPVVPGAAATINQQVKRLMGDGVDLKFCVVRPDYVAHALEEAQHLERISLLQGLDDPSNKPMVDILVPNGEVLEQKLLSPGNGFEASIDLNQALFLSPTPGLNAAPALQTMNFRGAARAETLPTGGGAFYLSADHQDHFFAQQLVDAEIISGVQPTATAPPTPPATAGATATATAAAATATLAPSRAAVSAGFLNTNAAILLPPRYGLWISLRCDSNVFKLGRGDTTNFNVRAIVASTRGDLPLFDLELNGVFQVIQETSTSGAAQKVVGHIENAQFSLRSERFGASADRITKSVDLDVRATLTGSAIEIFLGQGQSNFVLSADWGQQPLTVSAKVIQNLALRNLLSIPWAHAELKENSDVLSAKNASHVQALAALGVIAKTLNDANFADAKARLLFPPPPKPTDELLVRGTMDWVLFHRRRNKRCSEDICVQPVAQPRHYGVFHVPISDLQELDAIRKKLIEGKLPENAFNTLPPVDFAGGLATMLTNPTAWRSDWANIHPGNSVVYAAIANRDSAAADGDALALSRLDRLIDALAPVSTPNAQLQPELLDQVPNNIPAATVDGVIFLFTIKAADLRITKTGTPGEVTLGNNISYTVTLTNSGPAAALNVTVRDAVPPGTTFVSAEVASGSGWAVTAPAIGSTGDVVFAKASVVADETASFRIVVQTQRQTAAALARITNTATVAALTGDPNLGNNSVTVETPVVQQSADLKIEKSVVPLQHTGNGTLTYTLVVTNQGPGDALNVVVTDDLPTSVSFDSAQVTSGSGWTVTSPTGGLTRVSFSKGSVAAGETATFRIVVRVKTTAIAPPASTIANTATVSSATTDPVQSNNTATAVSTLTQPPRADLQITKTANPTSIPSGGTVSYTIRLTNAGPNDAQDVRVTDLLPSKDFFVSAAVTSGTGWNPPTVPPAGVTGGAVIFFKALVAANETATFQIVLREHGSAGGSIVNTATVESPTTDPVQTNNTDDAVVDIVQPQVSRRALVVFAQQQTVARVPLDGSRQTPVTFINNVPQGTDLQQAFTGFPPGMSIGRFRRITLAVIVAPVDAGGPIRLSAVSDGLRNAGGTVLGGNTMVLNNNDKAALSSANISIAGFDDVIYLELG